MIFALCIETTFGMKIKLINFKSNILDMIINLY